MNEASWEHRNRLAYDQRARSGARHTCSVLAHDLVCPMPIMDPEGWMGGSVHGQRVLCLAAGGGLQSALMAAAGAVVTVFDLSGEMLAKDEKVAREQGLTVRTVLGNMENLTALDDAAFDLVWQPVSTCYVPDLGKVYREVARVLVPGGLYIAQHKQPASLQADALPAATGGFLVRERYHRSGPLPETLPCLQRESEMTEFLHTWSDLIGGLARCGFTVLDLVEPLQPAEGPWGERCRYLPPYVKIKAQKSGQDPIESPRFKVWTP